MIESYGTAIRTAFEYILETYPESFVIGQGLWSPWYVGNSMTDLDKRFGIERVIDTPVAESACTGVAIGAALAGMKPIVVHPRMDFALYAMDAIVNQAAKWSHMTGGQAHPSVTVRTIINRGGEQGAQHSQSLHSWFSHVPGLRVVMPSTVSDARDLLIASVLSQDPVIYIDDRWLYEQEADIPAITEVDLRSIGPAVVKPGSDVTVVGSSFSTLLAQQAAELLAEDGINAEVVDLRVLNPFNPEVVVASARKTRNLIVVDGSWASCGFSAEVIASVCESLQPGELATSPQRITLPAAPAPTSGVLEATYYPTAQTVAEAARKMLG